MIKMRLVTQLVVVLLAIVMPGWLRAQAHRDRISGVVRSDSGRPVAAAGISVTRAPDRAILLLGALVGASGAVGWRLVSRVTSGARNRS